MTADPLRALVEAKRKKLEETKLAMAKEPNIFVKAEIAARAGELTVFCNELDELESALSHGEQAAEQPFAWHVDGPSGFFTCYAHADIEKAITEHCGDTGDDPDEYTATAMYLRPAKQQPEKPTPPGMVVVDRSLVPQPAVDAGVRMLGLARQQAYDDEITAMMVFSEMVLLAAAPAAQVAEPVQGLMSSQDDWTVIDCPGCGQCVKFSKKAASSKDAYRDLTAEVAVLRAKISESGIDLRCDQYVRDSFNGERKCANKRATGDTLCKKHRATAEQTGYTPNMLAAAPAVVVDEARDLIAELDRFCDDYSNERFKESGITGIGRCMAHVITARNEMIALRAAALGQGVVK